MRILFAEDWLRFLMSSIALSVFMTACCPFSALPRESSAMLTTWLALSAICRYVAASSSIVAVVSLMLAACSAEPEACCSVAERISLEAAARRLDDSCVWRMR